MLSFDGGKTITTGEGGAIITNNKKIYDYSNQYHDHGHENNPKLPRGMDTSSIAGFNYRFTQLQAVFGIEQLKKLSGLKKTTKKKYNILKKILSKNTTREKFQSFQTHSAIVTFFRVKNLQKRKKIVTELKKIGIGTKNLPDAIRWHCAYYWKIMIEKKQIKRLKHSLNLLNEHIAIPIFYLKSQKYYQKIANTIKNL